MHKVVICDDSAFMRRALKEILGGDPSIEIVGVGKNGLEAVELCKELSPDAMTLDIEMPEMDGLTALRTIMRACPTRVLMLSSLTTEGSDMALKAMRYGAADVMAKDHATVPSNLGEIETDLVRRVKALASSPVSRASVHKTTESKPAAPATRPAPAAAAGGTASASARVIDGRSFDGVLIGSSTGGPPVLETVLKGLPAKFDAAVVVAQHMPRLFTESMARRLGDVCACPVVHLDDRVPILPGRVHIAPGGINTLLKPCSTGAAAIAHVTPEPEGTIYFPSVDVLFSTGAAVFGKKSLGVVLTGMGHDGAEGAGVLRKAGGAVLTQSGETCVVNGMPKSVVDAASSDAQLTPEAIGAALSNALGGGAARGAA